MKKVYVFVMACIVIAAGAIPTAAITPRENSQGAPLDATSVSWSSLDPQQSLDELFRSVASDVPGFAGLHLDRKSDSVVVLMTSVDQQTADQARDITSVALDDLDLLAKPLVVKQVQYTFRHLSDWYDAIRDVVWSDQNTVYTDIDETKNRIAIGSTDPLATVDHLQQSSAIADIPSDVWTVDRTEVPVPDTSLQDVHRPVVGGLQVAREAGTNMISICTLGVIAYRGDTPGMVTNSHCSTDLWRLDSTEWGQPTPSWPIAIEGRDPRPFVGGNCPPDFQCRYSDASWAELEASVLGPRVMHDRGHIATPGSFGDPVSWNGVDTFEITSTGNPLVDEPTSFVGRTSGRQFGIVIDTCVDFRQSQAPSDYLFLCQSVTNTPGQGGDSGSPMFRTTGVGPDSRLQGIGWGSTTDTRVFSTIGHVQRAGELGALNVCTTTTC